MNLLTFTFIAFLGVLIGHLKSIYPNGRIATYFEIIDEPWLPIRIKQYLQDTMFFRWKMTFEKQYVDKRITEILLTLFQNNIELNRIIAIGTGGGGMEPFLLQTFRNEYQYDRNITLTLTDLVPNPIEWNRVQQYFKDLPIDYVNYSVDATNMPHTLHTTLTGSTAATTAVSTSANFESEVKEENNCVIDSGVCGSDDKVESKSVANSVRFCTAMIHHFEPPLVSAILADAVRKRQPIVFVDGKAEFDQFFIGPFRSIFLSLSSSLFHLGDSLQQLKELKMLEKEAEKDGSGNNNNMFREEEEKLLQTVISRELPRLALTWIGVLPVIQAHDYLASFVRFYGEKDMKAIVESLGPLKDEFNWHYHYDLPVFSLFIGEPKHMSL